MNKIQILLALTITLQLPAQDIISKLGGNTANETYDVTDSGDNLLFRIQGEAGALFLGTYGIGIIPATGTGTRMMWYPKKGAFRVGYVNGTQWDDANIGDYSIAMGANTTASKSQSIAMGRNTTASGDYSIAMGFYTTASGDYSTTMGGSNNAIGDWSTVMGSFTTASGDYSIAMGGATTASGDGSTAMGIETKAESYASVAIGRHNVGGGSAASWESTDPLFEIGIGTGGSAKANAMTVLKNGRVGIGTHNPTYLLDVAGVVNLNKGISTGAVALYVNSAEALWYNDDYFSWGYGGTSNYFADKVSIGSHNTTKTLYVTGSAGGTQSWNASDVRYKKNISVVNDALDRILQLRGVEYEWIDQSEDESTGFDNKVHYGVIAQEVEEIFPHLVDNLGKTEQMKHIEYNGFMAILIESIKEQQDIIEGLTKRIESLESN